MSVNLDDFNKLGSLMNAESSGASGETFKLAISLIDEDPNQTRTSSNPGFSDESINELADTIRERGVKSPISVREAGNGRYIINHGARRYRASIVAGLTEIPAVIDNDYTKLDQVIENIQRNNLTANEIAEFIREELKRGKSKKEISAELGKSSAWISQYCCIIDLPSELDTFWQAGVLGDDVTALSELCKCFRQNSEKTLAFLGRAEKISRREISEFKEKLEKGDSEQSDADAAIVDANTTLADTKEEQPSDSSPESHESQTETKTKPKKAESPVDGHDGTSSNDDVTGDSEDDDAEGDDFADDESDDDLEEPAENIDLDMREFFPIKQYAVSDFSAENYGGLKTLSRVLCVCTLDASDTEYEILNVESEPGKAVIKSSKGKFFVVPVDSLILSELKFE